jgi:hypothetical protein
LVVITHSLGMMRLYFRHCSMTSTTINPDPGTFPSRISDFFHW